VSSVILSGSCVRIFVVPRAYGKISYVNKVP